MILHVGRDAHVWLSVKGTSLGSSAETTVATVGSLSCEESSIHHLEEYIIIY